MMQQQQRQRQQEQFYRAAVALNNMGVSLLEKGAYAFAQETLRDAVRVMQHAMQEQENEQQGNPTSNNIRENSSIDIMMATALDRANQRCAIATVPTVNNVTTGAAPPLRGDGQQPCQQQQTMNPPTPAQAQSSSWSVPQNYSDDDDDEYWIEESPAVTGLRVSMSSYLCPMRIEPLIELEDRPEDVACARNFESAVVVYNFAVSYWCLAKTNARQQPQQHEKNSCGNLATLIEGGISLFSLSYTMIGNHLASWRNNPLLYRTLAVADLMIGNMALVLREAGEHATSVALCREQFRLRSFAHDYVQRLGKISNTPIASRSALGFSSSAAAA